MESRLRKRSLRPSETSIFIEEPPKKKSKKQVPRVEGHDKLKKSKSKNSIKHSSLMKKGKCVDSTALSDTNKTGRCLLVSLNVQEHDLQVHRTEKLMSSTVRSKGKGRVIQRSESVEMGSDFGSNNNGGGNGINGRNFKNPGFMFSSAGLNKKRVWKNLKQLLVAEKSSNPDSLASLYSSIDAPPSFNPAKKYSDLSGFIAKYTDPLTKIYYSNADEFRAIRTLSQDVVQGYLALRGKLLTIP